MAEAETTPTTTPEPDTGVTVETTASATTEVTEPEPPKKAATPKRKKVKRSVPSGQVHVLATFNNTIVTFTDSSGNVLTTCSAGACGFRGSKKGTAYAAQVAAERAAQAA